MFRKLRREEFSSPDAHLGELIQNLKDDLPAFLEGRTFTQHEIGLLHDMHSVIHNQEMRWVENVGGGFYNGGGRFAQSAISSHRGTATRIFEWIVNILLFGFLWLVGILCCMTYIAMLSVDKFNSVPGTVRWYSGCIGTACNEDASDSLLWPLPEFLLWPVTEFWSWATD